MQEQEIRLTLFFLGEDRSRVDADALLTRAEAVMGEWGPVVQEQDPSILVLTITVPARSAIIVAINDEVIGKIVKTLIGVGYEDLPHQIAIEPHPLRPL